MGVRIVFTRNERSFISRAIMWFTQRKRAPERRCSHVFFKFQPRGIFSDWWAFEAMERGCWISPYKKSLGSQQVVAEFEVAAPIMASNSMILDLIDEKIGDWYDFLGIWKWLWRILWRRWFGTLLKILKITFRPGRAHEGDFCSGLVLEGLRKLQSQFPDVDFGIAMLTPRTSSPQIEIDLMFDHPLVYRGGLGPLPDSK